MRVETRSFRFWSVPSLAALLVLFSPQPQHAAAQGVPPQWYCGGSFVGAVSRVSVLGSGACSIAGNVLTINAGTGGGGTITSIACGSGLTCSPSPITGGAGTITPDSAVLAFLAGVQTLTGDKTFSGIVAFTKAFAGIVSGTSLPWSLAPTVAGDAGAGTNSATPVFLNISPTVNLAGTTNNSGYTALLVNMTETSIGGGTKKLLDLEVGSSSKFAVSNTGALTLASPISTPSGTNLTLNGAGVGSGIIFQAAGSTLMDLGVSAPSYLALAANTSLAAMPGTGSVSLSGMTGDGVMPSGAFQWQGASGKSGILQSTAASISITAGASSTWSTSSGDLGIDAAGALSLGATNATSVTVAKAGIRNSVLGMVNQTVGAVLSVSGNAIAPTCNIHHVGAGLIKNITVPATITAGAVLHLIPDAAFTYDATGNIVVPAGGGAAVVNKLMMVSWDGSKWTPSY